MAHTVHLKKHDVFYFISCDGVFGCYLYEPLCETTHKRHLDNKKKNIETINYFEKLQIREIYLKPQSYKSVRNEGGDLYINMLPAKYDI